MRIFKRFAVAGAVLLISASASMAQQKKTPSLSTDDIVRPTSPSVPSAGAVSENSGAGKWSRQAPGNAGLTLELPGELYPFEVPLEDIKDFFHSASTYACIEDQIDIFIARLTPKMRITGPGQLRLMALGFIRGMAGTSGSSLETPSVRIIDNSTVAFSRRSGTGEESEQMEGIMKINGNDIWLISGTYSPSDESARAILKRVVDSVR